MSLIGLPPNYRFRVLNTTGVTMSVVSLTMTRSLFNSAGEVVYEATAQSVSLASSMANNSAVYVGAAFSNTSSIYLGLDGVLTADHSGTASGTLALCLAVSPDNSKWSDDNDIALSNHAIIAQVYFSTTTTKSVPIEL